MGVRGLETRRNWSATVGGCLGGAFSRSVYAQVGPEAFPGLPEAGEEGDWSLGLAHGTGRGHGTVAEPQWHWLRDAGGAPRRR